jgi:hypothetical protein
MQIEAQVIIDGTVINNEGNTLPNVSIFTSVHNSTTTNNDGRFEITCPKDSNSVMVSFSCIGYKLKSIKLYKGEKNVQILLMDSVINMNEISITAPKYSRFSNYAAQITKLNRFEVYTNPHALGDVTGSLQIMPGVQRNENDGRLIVQGGATDETQTYIDGLLLFNQYSLEQKNVSVRSRFTPDLFRGVALQSSGYSSQFGNAMSGILQLNTLSSEDMEEKIDINISSVSVETSLIKKTKQSSIRGNISYMNLTPYGSIVKDSYDWHKFYNQFSADLFMTNQFSSGIEIKTHLVYNKSSVDYSYKNVDDLIARNNLFEDNFMGSVVSDIPVSDKASIYAGINFAYNKFSGTDVMFLSDSVEDKKINSHQKIAFIFNNGSFTNSVGLENVYSGFNESYYMDTLYKLHYSNNQIALYDELSFLINKFNANIGLRSEYSTLLKKHTLSPRLYIAYKLSPENIFSLSLGRYVQLPNANYLKFSQSVGYNDAYSATASYSFVRQLSKLQFDIFYKKYNHLTTFNMQDFYYYNINNNGKGTTKGVNIFWKSNAKFFEYWLSYGYLKANLIDKNFSDYHTPSYLSNHTFNATLKYWIKGIRTMIGSSFFIDAGAMSYKESNPSLSKKTPSRNRMDISFSYVPIPSLIIHLSCQNVYGRNNVYGYDYSRITNSYKEITNPTTRFYYIGIFLTLSNSKSNQLKSL